jgi:hypothetical protein
MSPSPAPRRRARRGSSGNDAQTHFHREWLGLAQPIEGLVFSVPVLADAQIAPAALPELSGRLRRWLWADDDPDQAAPPEIADLRAFLRDFLGYATPGMLVPRAELPAELRFYAQEGRQEIRPSFAIARGPFAAPADDVFVGFGNAPEAGADASSAEPAAEDADRSPYVVLVWDLRDDAGAAAAELDLDKPEEATGPWRYPPTAKLERMLRHVGVPIGIVSNGRELRLVYAPVGESTSHLTFRLADMAQPAGRSLLAAFELLIGAERMYGAAEAHTLFGLLRESRRRQADVTSDLAAQVFEAVELLLEGFEQAALRESDAARVDWLREAQGEPHDHLYQGVLSVVLRLVFLLYAEDRGLLPVGHPLYARHLSVGGLYDDLVEDAGMHPESMHHRFGAYGRLLALFRAVFLGVSHGNLALPPRRGRLFDPSSYPFLEGGLPGSTAAIVLPEARADVRPPQVDDGVVYAVLSRLILFESQRLSYRALDVEQIGSVYESLMGYHVVRVTSPAVRLGKNRVWVETEALRAMRRMDRTKWMKEQCGLSTAQRQRVETALAEHAEPDALAEALLELAPGGARQRARHRAAPGKLVLQPGSERRRSGSHYTPRSLTERIVQRTLEPILACLGDAPTEAQLLSLKICDPAMGSGAFLVAACRHLADQLVTTWTREGRVAAIAERHGDAHLHARRLVAQRCLYGVDKNAAAVELAKLSLWLVTLSADLPFTFVDHALRHGDALVGLDLEQIAAFHWKPKKQLALFEGALRDALAQALQHRAEILELAEKDDAITQQEKRRLLDYADYAKERIRVIADVCVGAFFAETKDKARETERVRRQGLVEKWLNGDASIEPELRELGLEIREQHAPFHWWMEFPEVFYEARPDPLCPEHPRGPAYMEAMVGNPPFAGKNTITDANGPGYLDWLKGAHSGAHGNADLSAHFFRRVAVLLGAHGTFGLIATNTIAQGDTRTTGLAALLQNEWAIYDATESMAWPTGAAVTVSVVHAARGAPSRHVALTLHGQPADAINSRLRARPERAAAAPLAANAAQAFMGSIILGMGFTLSPTERENLIAADPRNAKRIFPYLGGQEVNSSPTQNFDRYVVNFGEMPLEKAEQWPDLIKIVREKVKPERDRNKREIRRKYWWRFGESQPAMFAAISPLVSCLVTARLSSHLVFSFQPTDRIFSDQLYIFPIDAFTAFAVLQSRVHEPWARLLSSSLEDRLRYAASDCFDTFPFPKPDPRAVIPAVEAAGRALYESRAAFMIETDQGLTKTYNVLKDPQNHDPAIADLRELHEAMDRAVLHAYGWSDIEVPPFCPRTAAEKAQLAAFEDEVIDRLYVLNAERAREEARLGLGGKGKRKKAAKRASAGQQALFGSGDS